MSATQTKGGVYAVKVAIHSVDGGVKKAVSIELTAFLAFFVFCEQAYIRLPKNLWIFWKEEKHM